MHLLSLRGLLLAAAAGLLLGSGAASAADPLPATPGAPPTAKGPDGAGLRATSASRLRDMLGAAGAGDPLLRPDVVSRIDARHPKVAAVQAAVDAANGARLASVWYDAKLSSDTKAFIDGYYEYVIHDTMLEMDGGPVRVAGGFRYGAGLGEDGRYPDYYNESKTQKGGEIRLEVGLSLMEALLTDEDRTERRQATEGVSLAEAERELTELVVTRDAVAAWSKWVSTGRILALDEALLEIAKSRQVAVQQRIDLGDLAQIELVRNRQILAGREAELADAQGQHVGAVEKMALYVRSADDGRPIRADRSRIPARNAAPASAAGFAEDPVELAKRMHPMLRAARARLEITELDVRLARARLLPDVEFIAGRSQDLGDEVTSLAPGSTMVGAKLKVPIAHTKQRGKFQATRAKREKALLDLAWLEDQIVANVRSAQAGEEAALERWRRSAESVELALQLQDAEQKRFDFGDIDLLRLWQIEQQTAKAIRNEVKAWQAYQIAVVELEVAVGQRFE